MGTEGKDGKGESDSLRHTHSRAPHIPGLAWTDRRGCYYTRDPVKHSNTIKVNKRKFSKSPQSRCKKKKKVYTYELRKRPHPEKVTKQNGVRSLGSKGN